MAVSHGEFLDRLRDLLCTVQSEHVLLLEDNSASRLTRIVKLTVQQTQAARGYLLLVDEDRGDLEIAAQHPDTGLLQRHIGRTGLAGFAIEDAQPIATAQLSGSSRDDLDDLAGITSQNALAVPLLAGNRAVGAIELRDHPATTGFGPSHIALATELAHIAASTIADVHSERILLSLFTRLLPQAFAPTASPGALGLQGELDRWLSEQREQPEARQRLHLARQIRTICGDTPEGLQLATRIVDALAEHARNGIA